MFIVTEYAALSVLNVQAAGLIRKFRNGGVPSMGSSLIIVFLLFYFSVSWSKMTFDVVSFYSLY